ncbi:3'(2'),5'-bisphosphate nucleotidase CysQ [Photobacterium damselae subsp. piscicida]|nr:3'(2'),5'-bisphosphate nucleotidase CysQ [Photobacterium damselae subsp. piscicida]MDP2568273.1 3'(2'),5'-bisphosphate nucleotidase CysQ [Photobacterium damselae subsp. piscicida]
MAISLDTLLAIATDAGNIILQHYHGQLSVETKADNSPVTSADLAANEIIVSRLRQLTPNIPILSEELIHQDWSVRQQWQQFWLVDPLDGTKEFIRKNGEFTVNIALVEQGKPILSVVHAPALQKSWIADGLQAWLITSATKEVLKVRPATVPTVVGSRSHPSSELQAYLTQLGEHKFIEVGSSLKFCLIAEGRAHVYPRLGPTMMWDTAAGQCVLTSAGGSVQLLDGQTLSYHRPELLNPYFIARN